MNCPHPVLSGEMHYARIPPEYWRARLRMARAMGVDAISTYVFWNRHEPEPGGYEFGGWNDVAAYVRLASEEDLRVILRPGPYVCAEWEFGGLPAWLLREGQIPVRSTDERYMAPVRKWLKRLGKELAPLQAANGGPIIAVQIENEYGAYGNDETYMAAMRDALVQAGFGASPFFTIDQPGDLAAGALTGIPIATTFAPGDPGSQLARIRDLRPDEPLLCGEYWAGWFDHWGEPHAQLDDAQQLVDLEWMLRAGASVNIYMLHGGTNFAFWNGANFSKEGAYQPTTTSYDYCAAIDEAGRPTAKYFAFREIIARVRGHEAPHVPKARATIEIPHFRLSECAPPWPLTQTIFESAQPLAMEAMGAAFGFVLYRTTLANGASGTLEIGGLHDYAAIMVDGAVVSYMDRRLSEAPVRLDAPPGAQLQILVENCGRANYGRAFAAERKGITGGVTLNGEPLEHWQMAPLPMDDLSALEFEKKQATAPAFYRGHFELDAPGDTFLDVRSLRKGSLWVNGRNVGRFWETGPQRTLFVPAPWLRAGANEIVAFDLHAHAQPPALRGVREPIFER